MSKSILPPQQHKQPSRKGKKAWRKNVDITEVQAGLEALREEVIQGGPIEEKDSKDIFSLDTIGSEDITKTYKLQKPLKADEILAQRSAIAAVDSRKRPSSRITDGVVELGSKRQKRDWISKKEVLRLREAVQGGSQLTARRVEEDELLAFDLWSDSKDANTQNSTLAEYLQLPKPKVAPRTLQKAPIALTMSGKPVRAVSNPIGGTSYNPSFEAWDDLLNKVGEKEIEAEKARLDKEKQEAERQARIDAIAAKEEAGYHTDGESAWEGFETDDETSKALKAKRPERKTQAERNKLKRRKEAERQAKREEKIGIRRKQAAEIEAVLKLKKQTSVTKELVLTDQQEDNPDVDETELRRRRLGPAAIPEKQLELVLPDELQDSLRRLKPEGNLLNDRFRNLLVNGKVEARKPILQPKKKRKTFTEKWSHKDFSIKV